jgi:hypothetical protein
MVQKPTLSLSAGYIQSLTFGNDGACNSLKMMSKLFPRYIMDLIQVLLVVWDQVALCDVERSRCSHQQTLLAEPYRSLAKYCTTWDYHLWVEMPRIASRFPGISPTKF